MSWLELVPLEGGDPISLPDGQTVIGRGPFLGVSDKRVSRNHGVLENLDGRLRLKSTHLNPCFVQSSLSDAPRALERERWVSLRHGDIFSLLPGRLMYQVEGVGDVDNTPSPSSRNIPEDEPEPQQTAEDPGDPPASVSPSEDHKKPVSQSVSLSVDQTQAVSPPEFKREKEEEEDDDEGDHSIHKTTCEDRSTVHSPEEKRRVLPAWMQAASSSQAAVGEVRAPKRPRANGGTPLGHKTKPRGGGGMSSSHMTGPAPKVRKTTDENHMTPKVKKMSHEDERTPSQTVPYSRRLHSDEEGEESDGVDTPPSTASQKQSRDTPPTPPTTANQKQRRDTPLIPSTTANQKQNIASSTPSTNGGAAGAESSTGGSRNSCPYGRSCYRKNPLHFQEFSHYGDPDYQEEEDKHEEDEEDRPECPYGTDCYRKNPLHRKEFKHTKRPARSSTRATKKRGGGDDDDDEDEESYDDSFIDDGDDSDDVWNDSDYAPPAGSDDSDGENIQRLQREAKAFMKKR